MSVRYPRITVLGAGHLGITHAACLAHLGFDVLAVDIDPAKITRLSAGVLPIYEPGLQELLDEGLRSRQLTFTTSFQHAAAFGDVHFICVGTPQQAKGSAAELTQLQACITTLAPLLTRPCVVIGKSTVPVGTAATLAAELTRRAPAATSAELAWNPEFLREGHAVTDTLRPDRIVAGVTSPHAEKTLRRVYAAQLNEGVPFIVTDLATAELAKAAANAFLATKISFINAMAEVCETAGADVTVLARILGADPRIGPAFLSPGLGFGGGCLPKDIRAFAARCTELGTGQAMEFLREVDTINLRCRTRVINLTCAITGGSVEGKAVAVLGAAFKPGSDDVRDSPALDVAQVLHDLGAQVTIYDPVAIGNARQICPQLQYAYSALDAARGADVVLLLTEWPEFIHLDPVKLAELTAARNILDGRCVLNPAIWRAAGWDYRALGVTAAAGQASKTGTLE